MEIHIMYTINKTCVTGPDGEVRLGLGFSNIQSDSDVTNFRYIVKNL